MHSPQEIPKATQFRMWLEDPVTQELLLDLERQIKAKVSQTFSIRRTNPALLTDAIAELELATALKSKIETGKFMSS